MAYTDQFAFGVCSSKKVPGLIDPGQEHPGFSDASGTISKETLEKAETQVHFEQVDLKLHSRDNCYLFDAAEMEKLQNQIAVAVELEAGTNMIKIQRGQFSRQTELNQQGEPVVMLWIYGGRVVNTKTGSAVTSTWSSLNGYDDVLTLDVLEPATLCAFFFDTGEVNSAVANGVNSKVNSEFNGKASDETDNKIDSNRTVQLAIVRIE